MTNILTNILCKIILTVVTNVQQTDNAKWHQVGIYMEGGSIPGVAEPATEQYTTTNVEEVVALHWDYLGHGQHELSRKLLSSVTAVAKLKSTWEASGLVTNSTQPYASFVLVTNNIQSSIFTNAGSFFIK